VRVFLIAITFCLFTIETSARYEQPVAAPVYTYRVMRVWPHDPSAYTEGLFYRNGILYEGTGENGRSRIRKVSLETGKVLQEKSLPRQYFGEGIAAFGARLFELTWQSHRGFIYDAETFEPLGTFEYPGEGWGLTNSTSDVFMSDGTTEIRCLDPVTLSQRRRFTVHNGPHPVGNLNELEYIDGSLFANIWFSDRLVRIDPGDGHVTAWVDLSGLMPRKQRPHSIEAVLNGIAWDASGRRLFVTGKLWPKLFEIELIEQSPR